MAYSRARRAELVRTTARGQTVRGVGPGTRVGRAKRSLGLRRRFRLGHLAVLEATAWRGSRLLAGGKHGRVRWLALASRRLGDAGIRRDLRRAR